LTRTHWFGEDVATIDTTLDSLPSRLPVFDRYEIAQVLAWVAAQRGNVAQRLQWRGQIRILMSHLVPALVA
jgi:hypothetical protein